MRRAVLRMRGSTAGTDSRRLSRSVALSAKDLITGASYNVRASRLARQQFPRSFCPAALPGPPLRSARSTTSRTGTLTTRVRDGHPRRSTEALLVEPGSSHQSGDRAAHTRPGDRRPPAQGPPREPTPDPNRTPDSRTMSKSVAKAPAHPTHCRQNRRIMRFHLDHPDPATAFATDLDNPPPPPTIHSPAARGPRTPNDPEHTRRSGPARRARHSPRAESPGHPPRPRTRADRPGGRSPRASRPQPDRGRRTRETAPTSGPPAPTSRRAPVRLSP